MIRTRSALGGAPELVALEGAGGGVSGRLVAFDRVGGVRGVVPAVRVLVADGQALVRAGFRVLLERDGGVCVVGEASTGEEAVLLAGRLRPDVVIIDAALPGLDCARATGRMSADSRVAVMVLAASEHDERVFVALRAGARGLLLKDAEAGELLRAVVLLARGDALVSPGLTRRLIAELSLHPDPQLPSGELLDELTRREREVVGLVGMGLSNADIAQRLVISPATAKTHVSRAMVKLGARDRAQVVALAYHTGLAVARAQATAPHALALGRAS